MSEKILTISVAAYNLENIIEENLKSFIRCKEKDFLEVIVTDDGSKDNTAKIVSEYESRYPEIIKLIRQNNKGAGSTVNSGIKNAKGKYFKMIDGDDWIESENLDRLINKLKEIEVDMAITNYETYSDATKKIIDKTKYLIEENKQYEIEKICLKNNFQMHNILYKTSILKKNEIVLDNGFYTDMEYLLLPIPFIKKVIYFDLDVYVYRIAREGQSVSLPSMQKNIGMHRVVLDRLIAYYEENKNILSENVSNYMLRKICDMADTELSTLLTFDINPKQIEKIKEYFKDIEKYNDLYTIFKKGKKEKILLGSNFKLVKIVLKKFYS